jgi:hypothetical protein
MNAGTHPPAQGHTQACLRGKRITVLEFAPVTGAPG